MARPRAIPAATFDIGGVARSSPHAGTRTRWMTDDAATIATAVLAHHPRPDLITRTEVLELVRAITIEPDAKRNYSSQEVKVGGISHMCSAYAREIRGEQTFNYSPRIPGVFIDRDVPEEPGIADKAFDEIMRRLRKLRHKGPMPTSVRTGRFSSGGFHYHEVELERPEGGGPYAETGHFEHKPDEEFGTEVDKIVQSIVLRWKARYYLMGAVHGAGLWARAMSDGVEGLKFDRAEVSYIVYNERGEMMHAYTTCIFDGIDEMLRPAKLKVSGHSDGALRDMANRHRKALAKLKAGGGETQARTVHPVLAAAIRDRMATYGAGILEEIEAVLDKKRLNPANPVKRGISAFSMKNGELSAPVTLAKGIRLHKERIQVKTNGRLPETVLAVLPGRRMRDVVDHRYLEGLTVKTFTTDKNGIYLRPAYDPVPLDPLLAELRAAVAAGS